MHPDSWFTSVRPYLAEIGRAAFASVAAIAIAALLLEYFAPGIVGNYVTPQHLAAAAAAAAALALFDRAPVSRQARSLYVIAAVAATVFAVSAVWRYLGSMAEARGPIAFAAGAAVLLAFISYAAYSRQRDAR